MRGKQRTRIVTGLNVVSKKTKHGIAWYVYAWRGGPCIHRQMYNKPVITAEMIAEAIKARGPTAAVDTFDHVVDLYRQSPEFDRLADSTKRDYRLWLDRISSKFGRAPLAAFEDQRMRREIIEWRNEWASKPRSADKASVTMATVLGWAQEQGIVSVNIAARIRQLHSVNKADQVWTDDHWQAIRTTKDYPAHLDRALRLASLTGLRLGDLVRLTWADVGDKAIILTTRKRKGRAIVPILPDLRKLLDEIGRQTGEVLRNSRGQPWTESGLGSVFQKTKPEGFDRTIHDLRGTYATWLAMRGLTDEEIARIIGWTAKRIGEIRARYVDEARVLVSLIDRLSAAK
jgi:integrase